jgi:cardiolipin synthase
MRNGERNSQADRQDAIFELAFARVTGSRPVDGNSIRLLKDAVENYPAWLDAIARAERTIHFENYIIADDRVGAEFARALAQRARAGIRVRLLYDWWGSFRTTLSSFWRDLAIAGVEVRAFNPPRLSSPLGWVSRDHRKVITIDGRIGFVSGLCVARSWAGDPEKGIAPWRDTGVELCGPVVADIDRAFAASWGTCGTQLPPEDLVDPDRVFAPGSVRARVVQGAPGRLSTYRVDQLVASAARKTLWLTDAYFVATTTYVRALIEADRDGVDVRLLVPGSSDLPVVQAMVRTGYRPLIEAGVRVFEWNGPMLHAKTAVSDGRWARIGSTNLNLASWLTNWELDVTIDDRDFAEIMEAAYLADLENATEIVLDDRQRVHSADPAPLSPERHQKGSGSRLAASALSMGSTAGAAITGSRSLSTAERRMVLYIGLALLAAAVVVACFPLVVIVPLVAALAWLGCSLLLRSWRLWRGFTETRAAASSDSI